MNIVRYETDIHQLGFTEPTIFLAGPTVRGNQTHLTSWRKEAIEIFQAKGFNGNLIVPEFISPTESDKYRYDLPIWENHGLTYSHVIMFWIPRTRELIGLTTNFEMGYWMAKNRSKVIYGRPDDSYRHNYNDIMWVEDAKLKHSDHIEIHNTLEDTIKASLNLMETIIPTIPPLDITALPRGDQGTPETQLWYGVHRRHCCFKHGCKYGEEDCPVVNKKVRGTSCEQCGLESSGYYDTW